MITVKDLAVKSAQKLTDVYGENFPNDVSLELRSIDDGRLSPDESVELVFLGLSIAQVLIGITQIVISVYYSKKSEAKLNRREIEVSVSKKIINIVSKSSDEIDKTKIEIIKKSVLNTLFEDEI